MNDRGPLFRTMYDSVQRRALNSAHPGDYMDAYERTLHRGLRAVEDMPDLYDAARLAGEIEALCALRTVEWLRKEEIRRASITQSRSVKRGKRTRDELTGRYVRNPANNVA